MVSEYVNNTVSIGSHFTMTSGIICNNTAGIAGDDVYADGGISSVTLAAIEGGETLTSTGKSIDGWYYDGYCKDEDGTVANTRWSDGANGYQVEYAIVDGDTSTLALKAAHKYVAPEPTPAPVYTTYTLTVRHVDTEGNQIASTTANTYYSGVRYTTSSVSVEGYTFDHVDASFDAASGYMTGNKTVVYVYIANELDIPDDDTPLAPAPGDTDVPDTGDIDVPVDDGEGDLDIPDEDVPLGSTPDTDTPDSTTTTDETTPSPDGTLDNSPKTSEEAELITALWCVFGLSGLGLCAIALSFQKKGKHQK
jgi:hypothetical protein